MSERIIGGHVDAADAVGRAATIGADIVQIALGDPQSWRAPVCEHPGGEQGLREEAEEAGVRLVVHSPFVINVASLNNRIRIPSRKLLQQTVNAADAVGAIGVVVHGGHVRAGEPIEKGQDNWRKAIDGLEMAVPVFVENTAGGDNAMARRLDRLADTWQAIRAARGGDEVGFCLDTCHAFAAGLDMTTVVDDVRAITGRIDLVHANDSQGPAGSGRDRHANLGEGMVEPDVLVDVIRAAGAPVVVETPGQSEGQARDITWLRARL